MAEPSEENNTLSAGQLLRQAREERGWTIDNVAKRLNLRASVVEKLEQDDYDRNSPATYTKGYIRAYCRLLELQEQDVMAELSSDRLKSQVESNMQSFSKRTSREKSDSWLTIVTWLIGLAFVGVLIYFGYQQATSTSSVVNKGPATQAQAKTEVATPADPQQAQPGSDDGVDLGQSTDDAVAEDNTSGDNPQDTPAQSQANSTNTAADSAAAEPVTAQAQAPVAATKTLEISFSGDCWVRIEDATGKRVLEGVKTKGQSFTLDAQAPYSIRLGAPETVTMTFQGQPVDLSGFRASHLAKLTLPKN
ncbi:RodZ domain-containing protein [Gallaecimonas mangrovi]|uniref:RodZ domain-containing protein n=1 Tax=Gallaecimonas mangrovi TaxID=2291597 RepID=UPI000E1FE804|nr:RodZ domain-containing protein [Gallaecimonas mangrovi]